MPGGSVARRRLASYRSSVGKGSTTAARLWARADERSRWRAVLGLGLLAGITAGLVFAGLAGARRTSTAVDRLRRRTDASDVVVFASQTGILKPDWERVRALPEVKRVGVWGLEFGSLLAVNGNTHDPNVTPGNGVLFAPADHTFGQTVDRSMLVAGRLADPKPDDEMTVDEAAVALGIHLGDVITFRAYAPNVTDGPPTGALLHLRVVGVVRNIFSLLVTGKGGEPLASAGTITQHRADVIVSENADVQLRDPGRDVDRFRRDVDRLIGPGTPILDLHAVRRRVDTTLSVERSASLLLALAMALAALVLVGQALVRSISSVDADAPTLSAIGFTEADLGTAAVVAHRLTVVVAVVSAFATAVVASHWFPVGLGGTIDPDRGLHIDWTVIGPGLVLLAAILVATAYLTGRRAARPVRETAPGRGSFVAWIRAKAPLPFGLGATMAFQRAPGRRSVPVRPALAGAVVGVLGMSAALTLQHGVQDSLDHPERAGVNWQAIYTPSSPDTTPTSVKPAILARTRQDRDVASASLIDHVVGQVRDLGVPTFALRPVLSREGRPPIGLTILSGRAPTRPDEVALGPATAKELHLAIGDRTTIGNGQHPATVRMVGTALFPSDVHAEFDEGAWLSASGFDRAFPPSTLRVGESLDRFLIVDFRSGVAVKPATAVLQRRLGSTISDAEPAEVPIELLNLANVRTIPYVLAAYLAVLAVAAVAHVLASSTRRRRGDFAVLRAIGMTRRSTRGIVHSQGTAIALVGLAAGIPVGIALGRVAWVHVADTVPLTAIPPAVAVAVILIPPAALLVANLVAVWPARGASRLHPAEVLRRE